MSRGLYMRPSSRTIAKSLGSSRWVVLDALLRMRAGNTGELIHNNIRDRYSFGRMPCWFCGCRSFFSFINDDEKKQGMDVFECLSCLSTITRFDVIGKVEWDEMKKRARERARKERGR